MAYLGELQKAAETFANTYDEFLSAREDGLEAGFWSWLSKHVDQAQINEDYARLHGAVHALNPKSLPKQARIPHGKPLEEREQEIEYLRQRRLKVKEIALLIGLTPGRVKAIMVGIDSKKRRGVWKTVPHDPV